MGIAYLSGRVEPSAFEAAAREEFVAADPDAVVWLRRGEDFVSGSLLARRGVPRLLYRLSLAPEVSARDAFAEGWIDLLASSREEAEQKLSDPALSRAARRAAARLADFPSREAAFALERAEFALIHAREDKREGISAFFARKAPGFSNR